MQLQKTDSLTGEKFLAKRINQRFSKAENRIAYNNKKAREIRHERAAVDKPLHVNYNVLNRLLGPKKEQQFHKEYLRGKGVDFSFHTHTEDYDGKLCYAVYRFVVVYVGADQIKIVQTNGIN